MPRVPTTADVSNPQRKGYDFRLDNLLFRTSISPDRQLVIRTAEFPSQQVDLRQNPEDITTNVGQIFSRNDFSGGQGLDFAHKRNNADKDITRYFDSKGVDVFHGDDETSYNVHLLFKTENKDVLGTGVANNFNGTNNYLIKTANNNLYVIDDTTIYESTDGGDSWSAMTPTITISYDIQGMAAFGNGFFFVTGDGSTGKQLCHYTGSVWHVESLSTTFTGYFTGIWYEKEKLLISGKSTDAEYLFEADPFDHSFAFPAADAIITTDPDYQFTSVTDAGAVILAANENGKIYSLKDVTGSLQIQGQTRIPFEEIHTIVATEGIVFFGTKESTRDVGRFYRAELTVADNLYVLGNRQLIKEWVIDSIDTTPHAMFSSRDSVYCSVQEDTDETYLWRYYLPTAGFARDIKLGAGGLCYGISQGNGKFVTSISGKNIYKETSLYEDEGYIITPNIDFFTSEVKQWVGTTVEHDEITDSRRIQCYISTREGTIDYPNSGNWELTNDSTQGFGGEEFQINRNARYLNMKIVLTPNTDFTGTPVFRSVSARALPRPQLIVVDIPVNISDQLERPNRKRIRVKNLGETVYQELKQKEGDSVTLELYSPAELIRGVVESVAYPVLNDANIGSVTQYCTVRIRGVRAEDITSEFTNIIGIGTLGVVGLG